MRRALGERVHGIFEMVVIGCLGAGSLGLFLAPYMPGAAPWGFAIPFVFAGGYALIDARRQAALAAVAGEQEIPDEEGLPHAPRAKRITRTHDLLAAALALLCAALGAFAFYVAYNAAPADPAQVEEDWQPPETALEIDMAPVQ
ncbi:MAG: hypothetical protein AB7J28_02850 [Hyphomonadaceae bacterium]